MQLSERVSGKGNRYLAGRLGKASVVAFQAEEPDKFGNPVWDVFVSTPEPRTDQRPLPLERPAPPAGGNGRDGAENRNLRNSASGDGRATVPKLGNPDPGGAPARPSASPVARGDGWRGPSAYRRPVARPAPVPAAGPELPEDGLEDVGRG